MSNWRPEGGDRYPGNEYVTEYRAEYQGQQNGPGQSGAHFVGQTDEWYQATRHAEQDLWYPEIPPDEAPEARAQRRNAYAEAVDATRFNLPVIGVGFLDPSSLQQLIPPRRGQIQGPGTLPGEETAVQAPTTDAAAAKTSVSRASRIMAMGTIASRLTGMARQIMLVAALGSGELADAFNVGNNLPNMVYMIVIGGAVNAIFVPQLVRSMKDDRDGGQAFIDRLLTMTIVFLGTLTVLAVVLAPQLVSIYAGGDNAAFEAVYDQMAGPVYGLIRKVLRDSAQSEEVAQEVLLEVWRSASRFDPSRGSAATWVLTIAHRRAVDRVRSQAAAAERDSRFAADVGPPAVDEVAESVVALLDAEQVRRCLDGLTSVQRESITLAYYRGYTYPQVAALLQVALGTVKGRIRDGLIRLRDCLGVTW